MTSSETEHTCKYCGTVELWFEGCVKNICLSCEILKCELPFFRVPLTAIILMAIDIEREGKRLISSNSWRVRWCWQKRALEYAINQRDGTTANNWIMP